MRTLYFLAAVMVLFTACKKQTAISVVPTPQDISRNLQYTNTEVVMTFKTKSGGSATTTLQVIGNLSYPTSEPDKLTFQGTSGYENIQATYVCKGQFDGSDIYAFSIYEYENLNGIGADWKTGSPAKTLNTTACIFNGQEIIAVDTNGVKIVIRPKRG